MLKKYAFLLSFIIAIPIFSFGQEASKSVKETMPLFNGARSDEETQMKVYKYFSERAGQEKTKSDGLVMISFVVDTSGSAVDPIIRGSNNEELNELAIKYVLEMPKWTPGMQNNQPVKTQLTVPIKFEASD